jgi:GxxExxY protein
MTQVLWTRIKGDSQDLKYKEVTEKILDIYFRVYNRLGYGFLEKVYENAMMIEFEKEGLSATAQYPLSVRYDGRVVGEYYADILVGDKVILEIKAARSLGPENEAQLLNYLRATDIEVGLLLNFGPEPEIRRKVFDNARKMNRKQNWKDS